MQSDCSDQMRVTGNAFQALVATTGQARSPSVERLVGGTSNVMVSLDQIGELFIMMVYLCIPNTEHCKLSPINITFLTATYF